MTGTGMFPDSDEDPSYQPSDVSVKFSGPSAVTAESLGVVGDLPNLDTLSLSGRRFAPTALAALAPATKLQKLFLQDTSTNDDSLVHLQGLDQLEMLGLARTQVTDRGLVELVQLRGLKYLSLNGLPISDAGVDSLCRMSTLTELEVVQTDISSEGLQRLRDALPDCTIVN